MKIWKGLVYSMPATITAWLIVLTIAFNVSAGELSVSLSQKSLNNADDVYSTNYWVGLQVSYQPDNSNLYYFLSKEIVDVAPIYSAWKYDMTGIGIGTKININKRIRVFGQAGYYLIKNSWGDRKRQFNEGLYYYFNQRFYGSQTTGKYYEFKDYSVENNNAIGMTIGLELLHPITDRWSAGFIISHRLMKIKEDLNAYAYNDEFGWWAHTPTRDYSSTNVGVSLNYKF